VCEDKEGPFLDGTPPHNPSAQQKIFKSKTSKISKNKKQNSGAQNSSLKINQF